MSEENERPMIEELNEVKPDTHPDIINFTFSDKTPKLIIKFNKDNKFYNLRDSIYEFLNKNNYDNMFVKLCFRVGGNLQFRTFSLDNETGRNTIINLLDNKIFELEEKFNSDDNFIETSGSNGTIELKVLAKDIVSMTIEHKNFMKHGKINNDNGGKFYPYKINKKYEGNEALIEKLARYQIFPNLNRSEFDVNCLVYALKMSGEFSEKDILNMKLSCYTRYISHKALDEFGKEYHINFKVVKYREDKKQWDDITGGKKIIGDPKGKVINLALIHKHYILNETVQGINKYYLDNYEDINEHCKDKSDEWKMKLYRKYKIDERRAHMKSYEFVLKMTDDFEKWSFDELKVLPTSLYDLATSEIKDLTNYCDKDFKPFKVKKEKEHKEPVVFYADTECDVSGLFHIVYCISYCQRGSNQINTLIGEDCKIQFLEVLPNNSIVYFHNLGYDAKMFSDFIILNSIDKASRTMSQSIKYNGKRITFKDSLSILSMKLSKFPETFKLKCGEKEMFPYNYYTLERLKQNKGLISEAGKDEIKINWNQKQFENNIDKLGLRIDKDYFDMKEYVKFYCEQDVRILAEGFDKFRQMCLESLQIDIDEVLTAPSLANKYFERELYLKIDNFYKYSGIVRAFIQQAIKGGRCMTRDNKKWKIENCELSDFDAVSLYPSAMARLYCQTGKPTTLKDEELNLEYLLKHTCNENEQPNYEKYISSYVVEIRITEINKQLHFPLIVVKNKKTNTNLNTNDAIGEIMVVDNITLEDYVKYQGVKCDILRGYKWTDVKDYKIRDEILKLHNLRCEYKKTKNPLQEVIKLIMNSAYGKMIQKPIVDRNVYKQYQTYDKDKNTIYPLNNYIIKNSAKIKEITQINRNIYLCKVAKQIETFATNTLLGVQVLSMSKRIMNEVMTTAEDLNINIYYQDTDSIHIEKARLQDLANEFKLRFNRELIGKNLGQFHNDFEIEDGYSYRNNHILMLY